MANTALQTPLWYSQSPESKSYSWESLLGRGPLPALNVEDDELQQARRAALNALQYMPRTADWAGQVAALRGGQVQPPRLTAPVAPTAPSAPPLTWSAPVPQAPSTAAMPAIPQAGGVPTGGQQPKFPGAPPLQWQPPGGDDGGGIPPAGTITYINKNTGQRVNVKPGSNEQWQVLNTPDYILAEAGTEDINVAIKNPNKPPLNPLPKGYVWQWNAQAEIQTQQVPMVNPSTGQPFINPATKQPMTETREVYVGRWQPSWVGTDAMSDFQKWQQVLQQSQFNAGQGQQSFENQMAQANQAFSQAQVNYQNAWAQHQQAVAQGNWEKEFTANQALAQAKLALDNAGLELQKLQQSTSTEQWAKQFAANQQQTATGNQQWQQQFTQGQNQFTASLEFQKQKAAMDTLLQFTQLEEQKRSREAEMAANPRDWIKYSLVTKGGLPGSTAWLSKLTEMTEGETIKPAAINVPSAYDWNKMLPTDRAMLAGYGAWMGIPWEDLAQRFRQGQYQGGTIPQLQWAATSQVR